MFILSFDWLYLNIYGFTAIDFFKLFPQLAYDLYKEKADFSKIGIVSIADVIKTALDVSSDYFPSLLNDAYQMEAQNKHRGALCLYEAIAAGESNINDYFMRDDGEPKPITVPENDLLLSFCKNHGQRIEDALINDLKFLMMAVSFFELLLNENDKYTWEYNTSIDDILDKVKIVESKESFDRIIKTIYKCENIKNPLQNNKVHYLDAPFLFALHRSADPSKNPYVPRSADTSRNKHIVPGSFFSAFTIVPLTTRDVVDNLKNFAPSDSEEQKKVGDLITRYSPEAIATVNQYFTEHFTAITYLDLLSKLDNEIIIEALKKLLLSPLFKTRTAIIKAVKDILENAPKHQTKSLFNKQVMVLANYVNYLYDSYTYISLPAAILSYTFLYEELNANQINKQIDKNIKQISLCFKNEYSEDKGLALKALMDKTYKRPYDFYEKNLLYKVKNSKIGTLNKLHNVISEPNFSTHIKNSITNHKDRFTIINNEVDRHL